MTEPEFARRPIKARDSRWAAAVAAWLARVGVRPNMISVCSAIFAGAGGACLAGTARVGPGLACGLFVAGAACIQLRLLCNLFDGMVAIEGGLKTKSGDVFNELPDRFADVFVLVGCGYATGGLPGGVGLGWLAAVLALGTAYVRALGASAGAGQCFLGPMAKQHRMAVVTTGCLLAAGLLFKDLGAWTMFAVLVVTVIGAALTVARRTIWVVRALEARP